MTAPTVAEKFYSKLRYLTGGAEPLPYYVIVYFISRIAVYSRLIFIGRPMTAPTVNVKI